jgi:hypothetical protein
MCLHSFVVLRLLLKAFSFSSKARSHLASRQYCRLQWREISTKDTLRSRHKRKRQKRTSANQWLGHEQVAEALAQSGRRSETLSRSELS